MQRIKELFCDSWIDACTLQQVKELDEQYHTPCYLLSRAKARENVTILKKCLGEKIELCYAVKANPWLAELLKDIVDRLDICTEGELQFCLERGAASQKLLYEGPYKKDTTLSKAMNLGIGRISIDSMSQWKHIYSLVDEKRDGQISVLLRLNCGNQFGMEESEIVEILKSPQKRIHIAGLHYYGGTQKQYLAKVKEELDFLEKQILRIEDDSSRRIDELEFGAGSGVPYFESDSTRDCQEVLCAQIEFVQKMSRRYHVIFEAGRCIGASAGAFLTKVVGRKEINGLPHIFVDGGTNQINYYGWMSGQRTPKMKVFTHKLSTGTDRQAVICGCLCASADIFARKKTIQNPLSPGDYMMFRNVGAYVTECSLGFLFLDFPPILMYNEKQNVWEIIRRRVPSYNLG